MSLIVNGITATSMRWVAGWSGVWIAELELAGDLVPSGKVTIVSTEGIALVGTVDDKLSGTFGEKRHARVIAGGGGWGKDVRAQHYHSDVGLALGVVVSTTAAEAGELATVLVPQVLGLDFVRRNGPAAQIFADAGVDWWVGTDGVTRVGVRIPSVAPLSLQVLDWQPSTGTVSFACDALVEPGAIVVDTRFGTKIVREVEATVSEGSVSGTLWLVDAAPTAGTVSELARDFAALARMATRAEYGRFYEYRVIDMAGDRVELQAVSAADGMPDVLPASVWGGISGYKATLTPGSRVLVGFRGGDPKRPFVAFYEPPEADGWRPLVLELDATTSLLLGAKAASIVLGDAALAQPIARSPAILTWAQALQTAVAATASTATATGATPVTGATLGGWLSTLAAAIGTANGDLTSGCPSAKAVSS